LKKQDCSETEKEHDAIRFHAYRVMLFL